MGLWSDLTAGPLDPDDFDAFVEICADPHGTAPPRRAVEVVANVPVYDGPSLVNQAEDDPSDVLRELGSVIGAGAGVVVIRSAFASDAVEAMTKVLLDIVARENEANSGFDHFAAKGANTRAWDTVGKTAKADASTYVAYYGSAALDLVCEAWLGPRYSITGQVNIVHPGGAAQSPHRDYHLGFMPREEAERYPPHTHRMSQALTLQAGIAHGPTPLEAGPTMVLPGSQRFGPGYLAWPDERYKAHFAEHAAQVPLELGDAIFFNPAIHHGAGENRTDRDRLVNLMQVSSAFGVPMENVDWPAIAVATYPVLADYAATDRLEAHHLAVCASGYPWPSNLDTDPSTGGLAPPSLQDLLRDALERNLDAEAFAAEVAAQTERRRPA